MDIMDEVNCTVNNLTEGVEDDAYVGTTPTAGTEVIKDLTGRDPGSQSKRLKDFLPTVIEAISDPVMGIFFQATGTSEPQCRGHCWGTGKHLLVKQQDGRRSRRSYNNIVYNGRHHKEFDFTWSSSE